MGTNLQDLPAVTSLLNDDILHARIIATGKDKKITRKSLQSMMMPIGFIIEWGVASDLLDIPDGYLPCDGSAISRTTYSELNTLMSVAGYPWGNGDGSTTFNLPKGEARTDWLLNEIGGATIGKWTNVHLGDDPTQDSNFNHDLKMTLSGIDIKVLISPTGNDSDSFEANGLSSNEAGAQSGFRFSQIDLSNIQIQTVVHGLFGINDDGTLFLIDAQDWYYKLVATNKAMSARSIIKV